MVRDAGCVSVRCAPPQNQVQAPFLRNLSVVSRGSAFVRCKSEWFGMGFAITRHQPVR